jgi:histidine triad (HIT) family protein
VDPADGDPWRGEPLARVVVVTDCLFCRMVAGEISADVVLDTDRVLAFRDINPQAPTHVLVIPKEHHANVGALAATDPALLGDVVSAAHAVARSEGLVGADADEPGYRLVTNTGPQAGQTVHHVHVHLLGGRDLRWPPG